MTPTFSDFFKSCYYSNTYLPFVDLSDRELAEHLLVKENPEAAATAQNLISQPEIQEILSTSLSHNFAEEIEEKNACLEKYGFKLLSETLDIWEEEALPYFSVVEHDDLQGWIIKSGAVRSRKDEAADSLTTLGNVESVTALANDRHEMTYSTTEENLLRIPMATRIRQVAQKANIDLVLPKKMLVAYANTHGVTEPIKKYCLLCEKIHVLSAKDTMQAINDMDAEQQKDMARKIATIVKKAGFAAASFDNIRLTPDGKLTIINTVPTGLMVAKKQGLSAHQRASVEKCARIGLFTLMEQSEEINFSEFHKQIKQDYENIAAPKLSKWKITLSILSLGLIPLINAIIAFVKTKLSEKALKRLTDIETEITAKIRNYLARHNHSQYDLDAQQELQKTILNLDIVQDLRKKRTAIQNTLRTHIEGVPF